MTRPGEVEVRHGYSYDHLDRLAYTAVNHAFGHGLDLSERYACAWHAIVVALYEATDPPSPQTLIRAGGQAITQAEAARQKTLGYDTHARWAGPATIGRYWKYWNPTAGPLPEDIIDTVAMRQILATLTDRDRLHHVRIGGEPAELLRRGVPQRMPRVADHRSHRRGEQPRPISG